MSLEANAAEFVPSFSSEPTIPTISWHDLAEDIPSGLKYFRFGSGGWYFGKHLELVWKHGLPLCPVYLIFEGDFRNVEQNLKVANAMLDSGYDAVSKEAFDILSDFEADDNQYEREQEASFPWLDSSSDLLCAMKLPEIVTGGIESISDSAMAVFLLGCVDQSLQEIALKAMVEKYRNLCPVSPPTSPSSFGFGAYPNDGNNSWGGGSSLNNAAAPFYPTESYPASNYQQYPQHYPPEQYQPYHPQHIPPQGGGWTSEHQYQPAHHPNIYQQHTGYYGDSRGLQQFDSSNQPPGYNDSTLSRSYQYGSGHSGLILARQGAIQPSKESSEWKEYKDWKYSTGMKLSSHKIVSDLSYGMYLGWIDAGRPQPPN